MSWRRFLRRDWWDRERSREIDTYLEMETAENLERGMPPDEAAAAARKRFGNPGLIREEIYRMNSIGWLDSIGQDLRYAGRVLRMNPGFASVAILSLALGIGANTAIFQLLDAVRLRSLPVENPRELAEVRIVGGNQGMGLNTGPCVQLTRPLWEMIRDHQQGFSGMFAWGTDGMRAGDGSEMRHVSGIRVTGDFFRVLGVQPWRGRLFVASDEAQACPGSTAVVSYRFWQSHMGARELDGNSKLLVDGTLREVIGVTPPGFFGLVVGDSFDVAVPYCRPQALRGDIFELMVMGRLRPGWTLQRATAQLDAISPGIFAATTPSGYASKWTDTYKKFRLEAVPASGGVSLLRATYDSSLWLLLAITGMVLLIACANLANLMLAKASTREREIAVRLALGASRGRLLRQLLVESGVLSLVGAVLGVAIAQLLGRVLVWSLSTESGSVILSLDLDWRVILFASAVATMTCIVFGAAPALRATQAEPVSAMKAGGRGLTAGRHRFSMQRLMVSSQIAVCLVLLVGALLFVRSFRNLMTFDPGMREKGIEIAFIGFKPSQARPDRYPEFEQQLVDEVRTMPGVLDAATTTNVPLLGGSWEHQIHTGGVEGTSKFTWVSPGYFDTMGIPLLSGREFTEQDTKSSRRVALVNQTFAKRFLPGSNPIGKTVLTSAEPDYPATKYEIVGVIPDSQYNGLRGEVPPMTFAPASQYPPKRPWTAMMIHSAISSTAAMAEVKRVMVAKHPGIEVEMADFEALIRDGLVRERMMAILSGFFGLLAALLASVGLYGVISYIVARRRNEIGIRMALGAGRGQVVGMIMREAGWVLAAGVVVGMALSLLAGRAANSLLFGLKPNDPVTLLGACALLAAIAGLASFLPARRAAKLDPMIALRYE